MNADDVDEVAWVVINDAGDDDDDDDDDNDDDDQDDLDDDDPDGCAISRSAWWTDFQSRE